ncbi:HNH endonuclease [Flavobacterium sp. UW10123]|uniref:HNH endonuclease n=1 Tax=Flavobacterium sp. UW10123 TaxID=3230800 RepID=UPI003397C9AF
MAIQYILADYLPIPNEVVLRKKEDDRREIAKKKNANDIIYLGTKKKFTENVSNLISNEIIDSLYDKFEENKQNGASMQKGSGILVKHCIDLKELEKQIKNIDKYLTEFKTLYRNPNFNKLIIQKKINKLLISSKNLEFYSDLVFISDKSPKPYFKWFRDVDEQSNSSYEFVRQFLIPKILSWNFKIDSFDNEILSVTWKINFSKLIELNKNTELRKKYNETKAFVIENILSKSSELSDSELETIKNAVIKIRLRQSKFRKDLLSSSKNKCIFTDINEPRLLIAGHIKPWSKSINKERLDVNNGILLTPTFDKLFDKFLISFDENGKVMLSEKIEKNVWVSLFPSLENITNTKITIDEYNKEYLEYHRNIFKQNVDGDN